MRVDLGAEKIRLTLILIWHPPGLSAVASAPGKEDTTRRSL